MKEGNKVHVDTDNKEWGRVASDGIIIRVYKTTCLVQVETIRACLIIPKEDINPKE